MDFIKKLLSTRKIYHAIFLAGMMIACPIFSFSQLSGTYTIGSGGDYTTFQEVADTLHNQGVNGPVVFNVLSGTYNEQFTLDYVPYADETNTITFQSQSGDSTDVVLKYDATGDADNFLIKLKRLSYLTLRGMTFWALDKTYNRIITIENYAEYLTIENCFFKGTYNTNALPRGAHIQSENALITHMNIQHNWFSRGSYGIVINSYNQNNLYPNIRYNRFDSLGYCAVSFYTSEAPDISYNTINYSSYGIYLATATNATYIHSNQLRNIGHTGMFLSNMKSASGFEAEISNNMIAVSSSGPYGMDIRGSYFFNLYYNTILVTQDFLQTRALSLNNCTGSTINILNNNVVSLNDGYAIYVSNSGNINHCDHNNFYTPGRIFAFWNDHGACEDFRTFREVSQDNLYSVFAYPYFISETDLHARSAWLDNRGIPISGLIKDIDGETRSIHPDIGADEFMASPDVKPTLSGTMTIGNGGDYANLNDAVREAQIKGISDTLRLQFVSGTYEEQCVIPPIPGTSSKHPVILEPVSGKQDDVHIRYQAGNNDDNYVIKLAGSSFLIFRNLSLEATGTQYGKVLVLRGMVDSLQVDSCMISGTPQGDANNNARLVFSNHLNFHNLVFHGNSFINGSTSFMYNLSQSTSLPGELILSGNTFPANGYQAVYLSHVESPVISKNNIQGGDYGIFIGYTSHYLQVDNNYIRTEYGSGLQMNTCSLPYDNYGRIYNNFIVCAGTGPNKDIFELMNCEQIDVYYNSVSGFSNTYKTHPLDIYQAHDVRVRNNVFSNQGSEYAIYVKSSAFNSFDYNCFYSEGTQLGYWDQDCADLDAIKTASGMNGHSISADPGFVSDTNLHVTAAALDSAAAPVSWILKDYDGDPRNEQYPDIGADEFGGGLPNRPPVAVNDTVDYYYIIKNQPYLVWSLMNDSDPEGDSIYISDTGVPAYGQVYSHGDYLIYYLSQNEYSGLDSMIYYIKDVNGLEDSAWVFVRVKKCNEFSGDSSLLHLSFYGYALFCDYDLDQDLDILLSDMNFTPNTHDVYYHTWLYSSDGDSLHLDHSVGSYYSSQEGMVWGDYDNDGDADLIMTGLWFNPNSQIVTRLFENKDGALYPVNADLENVGGGSVAWGDFDNDGNADLVISGITESGDSLTKIYRNDGSAAEGSGTGWVFTDIHADLPASILENMQWVDFDLDGDLDLFMIGKTIPAGIYENGNGTFTLVDAGIPEIYGHAAIYDYDNDGDPDIALMSDDSGAPDSVVILRNDVGPGNDRHFVEIQVNIPVISGKLNWGDFDNDGDADLLVTGKNRILRNWGSWIYYNHGNDNFEVIQSGLPGAGCHSVSTGDFDNDQKLDILMTSMSYRGIIFNQSEKTNIIPGAPDHLRCETEDSMVCFIWSPAQDAETPSPGLSYNIRVGTTPGGSETMSAMADPATGFLLVPKTGRVMGDTTLMLYGLHEDSTYYWSVQAVDPAYGASAFSPEQSFTVKHTYDIGLEFYDPEGLPLTKGHLLVAHRKEEGPYSDHVMSTMVSGGSRVVKDFPRGYVTASFAPDTVQYPELIKTYLGGTAFYRETAWFDLERDTSGVKIYTLRVHEITGNSFITGTVINSSDSSALYGKWVFMIDSKGQIVKFDVTDSEGRFHFDSIPPGHYYFDGDFWYNPMDENNDSIFIEQDDQEFYIAGMLKSLKIKIEISNITGRNDIFTTEGVMVYPNPVLDVLYLNIEKTAGTGVTIRFIGMDGSVQQIVHAGTVSGNGTIEIPVSGLPPGLYILSVESDKINYKTRVIKMK